jgi:hypothetical protein
LAKIKFNTLEYWKAVADACNKDETYIQYCKETNRPLNIALKLCQDNAKCFIIKFDNGKIADVHEAKPDEKADAAATMSYDAMVTQHKGERDMMYLLSHGQAKLENMMTFLTFAKPISQMMEVVAPKILVEY